MGRNFAPLKLVAAEFRSLLRQAPGVVEDSDSVPVKVSSGVETPVRGNEEAGAEGSEMGDALEEDRGVALHAVEVPLVTERVEDRVKSRVFAGPVEAQVHPQILILHEPLANPSIAVLILRHVKDRRDLLPSRSQGGAVLAFALENGVLVLRADEMPPRVRTKIGFVSRDDRANFRRKRGRKEMKQQLRLGIQGFALPHGLRDAQADRVEPGGPKTGRRRHPRAKLLK